jgi:SPP1 family predicted phage head-tail adaptor
MVLVPVTAPPSAGRLNRRATFSRQDRADDGGGGVQLDWTPFLTVWAALMPERGKEALEAGRLQTSSMATLRIRYSSEALTIDASCKVTIDGDDYQIRSIADTGQKRKFLDLVLEKGVANG